MISITLTVTTKKQIANTTETQIARQRRFHCLLGEFHFNLLANFLALLVTPCWEDIPVLQLLLAGPVS